MVHLVACSPGSWHPVGRACVPVCWRQPWSLTAPHRRTWRKASSRDTVSPPSTAAVAAVPQGCPQSPGPPAPPWGCSGWPLGRGPGARSRLPPPPPLQPGGFLKRRAGPSDGRGGQYLVALRSAKNGGGRDPAPGGRGSAPARPWSWPWKGAEPTMRSRNRRAPRGAGRPGLPAAEARGPGFPGAELKPAPPASGRRLRTWLFTPGGLGTRCARLGMRLHLPQLLCRLRPSSVPCSWELSRISGPSLRPLSGPGAAV